MHIVRDVIIVGSLLTVVVGFVFGAGWGAFSLWEQGFVEGRRAIMQELKADMDMVNQGIAATPPQPVAQAAPEPVKTSSTHHRTPVVREPAARASRSVNLRSLPPIPPKPVKPPPENEVGPVQPRLSVEDIVAGVKKNAKSVIGCLRAARKREEIVPGKYKMVLNWDIRPDGQVENPRVSGPAFILKTSLPDCFAIAMEWWTFPRSRSGAPIKNFPFGPITVR